MESRRVAVVGLGIVSPNGIGLSHFEQALRKGESGIRFDEEFEKLNFACQVNGRIPLSPAALKQANRELRLVKMKNKSITFGLMAIKEAWEDAGFEFKSEEKTDWDTGCIFGNESPSADVIVWATPIVREGKVRYLGSKTVQQTQNSGILLYLNQHLGLGNALYVVGQACATGSVAIAQAFEQIRSGKAKRMIAGSSEMEGKGIWAPFDALHAMTRDFNDRPEEASCPMSAHSSGLVPGSGAAALILEDFEEAEKRGARIYAELKSAFTNSGGQKNSGSMTLPNPEGVKRCISTVISSAGLAPDEIDLISGHLTSTMADPIEINAWCEALERKGAEFPYINSLKSMIGHSFGAAGSQAALATVLQLHKGFVHPSLNSEDLHPEIAKLVDRERIPLSCVEDSSMKYGIQSSFGFGDLNTCLLFEKA